MNHPPLLHALLGDAVEFGEVGDAPIVAVQKFAAVGALAGGQIVPIVALDVRLVQSQDRPSEPDAVHADIGERLAQAEDGVAVQNFRLVDVIVLPKMPDGVGHGQAVPVVGDEQGEQLLGFCRREHDDFPVDEAIEAVEGLDV